MTEMADSRLDRAARIAGGLGYAALRPVASAGSLAVRVEREARAVALGRASDAALAGLDVLLASRLAQEALDRVLASALARRAVSGALEGPLVETVARELAEHAVVERVLADGVLEEAAARVLAGPELERVVASALDSPAMERLVARVIESSLLDAAVDRLLESDELWLVVDEIAHSPAVTDAIAQQSIGFADQVAGGVRARSRSADAWIEGKVRRALRRRTVAELPAEPGPTPGAE